ncbi:MAG TPA: long-chain fatty acid transporter, partial [Algoriphagus sp.]|nr:long-chain fatty acid transporter [Algoriphagus sp.]
MGQPRQYNTSNFSIPNLSVVFANPKGPLNRGAFKAGSFGISIQRIANFNTEYGFFSDEIGSTSIIDFYLQNAIGVPESQIPGMGLTGLAYNTYLINPLLDSNGNAIPGEYDPVIGFEIGAFQDENITQEGNASQITFSYGANFNHKLFVGGSLGIRSLNFASRKVYNEEFAEGPLFNTSLRENLFINGTGVNLNLGLIYKPIDQLNLGFNFQSPTWYSLNEEYDARIIAEFDNFYYAPEDITLRREEAATDFILSSYGLNSPLKVGAGATFFLGKN